MTYQRLPVERLRAIAAYEHASPSPCDSMNMALEVLHLRDEIEAIRGRDAKPFDWDVAPTVEEWIADNLRVREPRAGSAMVELHPEEVVADRGESRRVAGWLKDLLAERGAMRRRIDELREHCSQQRAEWLAHARTDPVKAVRASCAAVAGAFNEMVQALGGDP